MWESVKFGFMVVIVFVACALGASIVLTALDLARSR